MPDEKPEANKLGLHMREGNGNSFRLDYVGPQTMDELRSLLRQQRDLGQIIYNDIHTLDKIRGII